MTSDVNPIDVLRARGFVQDLTDESGLRELFATERVSMYVGFDPTAASLHIGNLVGMMALAWVQRLGHRPIALAGGATGRIGDPSGRDDERELLGEEQLAANLAAIRSQLGHLMELDGGDAGMLVDNYDWTREVSFLDFLRDVGKHFSVNAMISRESVKRRLAEREQGISFTEFSYQLLQAFDFLHLYEAEGCKLQGGGSDQWGNITAGTDLIRKVHGASTHGVVWPLVTTSGGEKFGKSAGNAVWLDPELTSPYRYFQYWMNTVDDDVERFLRLFTFLDLDEVDDIVGQHAEDPSKRLGQRRLAEEATRILHGEAALDRAAGATEVLFGGGAVTGLDDRTLDEAFAAAPTVELARTRLDAGVGLLDLMTSAGAAKSNGEARRLVQQGGVRVNNVKVDDPATTLGPDDLASDTALVLRVGKKRYYLARFL